MKSRLFRDRNIRLYMKTNEMKNKVFRILLEDQVINTRLRHKIMLQLTQKNHWATLNRVKNRCLITQRSRGVWRNTKLSRLMFRKLVLQGYLPGFVVGSW